MRAVSVTEASKSASHSGGGALPSKRRAQSDCKREGCKKVNKDVRGLVEKRSRYGSLS